MDKVHDRAAPAGGAWKQGRGCVKPFTALLVFLTLPVLVGAEDALINVPSGQVLYLTEMLQDEAAPQSLVRFRFVAPEIAVSGREFENVVDDMAFLCNEYALPRLAELNLTPHQVVISLASAPVEFGEANPSVTQYFEAYSVETGRCIWEVF